MSYQMGPEWKYQIILKTPDWHDVQQWCESQFGEFDNRWYKSGIDPAEYIIEGAIKTVWYFKEEKDAVLFSLRWL